MRPKTDREFRELALQFGATCTKGSIMLGVATVLVRLNDDEEVPLFATALEPMVPLVKEAKKAGNMFSLEVLCNHFADPVHFRHILRRGTIIGNEIETEPKVLRPVLHTLLPLDEDGIYRNAGVELELLNQIEFGSGKGTGFWAAHMAGRIWIPRGNDYRKQLLARQESDQIFAKALRAVANGHQVIDFYEYRRLLRQTQEAKKLIANTGR